MHFVIFNSSAHAGGSGACILYNLRLMFQLGKGSQTHEHTYEWGASYMRAVEDVNGYFYF